MTGPSDLQWAIDRFVHETPGVVSAQTVSADGMFLAAAGSIDDVGGDQMAAICAGVVSLTDAAAGLHNVEPVKRMLIEAAGGWIILSRINERSNLAVVTEKSGDIGMIGYEMNELAESMGNMLSPALIDRMKNNFARS